MPEHKHLTIVSPSGKMNLPSPGEKNKSNSNNATVAAAAAKVVEDSLTKKKPSPGAVR
ncbi:hypothetical protein ACP4OV_025478 [Aristida adscensionis]